MRLLRLLRLVPLVVVAALVRPAPAVACGGCFTPPETITSVSSHRMVVSLSTERTTLWDQIQYTGDPADFVWVLPVPSAAADIELADPLFFDELEAYTAPQVQAPPLAQPTNCATPPFRGEDDQADPVPGDPNDVTVYNTETVGPYETVTIGSQDASALHSWLLDHGYRVPVETLPTIQYYVDRGSVFVVLRLAPAADVDAMQPIRVRYPGYMATFPLRMVTVGASGALDLTLWVIGDQRFEAANYGTLTIDPAQLVWDWDTLSSNYRQVFSDTIEGPGYGRAWITEYATPLDYLYLSSADEVTVASTGLPYPYLTRLRTSMLLDHLDEDLELRPTGAMGDVQNFLQAQQAIGEAPVLQCPDWDGDGDPDTILAQPAGGFANGCTVGLGGGGAGATALLLLGVLAALGLLAQTRRK